ncbi:prolipoprotein diacylglyceryl transferase, partial [Escherichia coli]|nr:prolipoprotein diacylglyceryl transferase [Escherichia coli]
LGFLWGGLTMGMILSVPMIVAGLIFIWAAWRRWPRTAGDGAAKAA